MARNVAAELERCDRKGIPVRYRQDPRELTTDDLLKSIEAWLKGKPEAAQLAQPINDVKLSRKIVLNTYSHSTPINLAAAEVQGAIESVEALHAAFQKQLK